MKISSCRLFEVTVNIIHQHCSALAKFSVWKHNQYWSCQGQETCHSYLIIISIAILESQTNLTTFQCFKLSRKRCIYTSNEHWLRRCTNWWLNLSFTIGQGVDHGQYAENTKFYFNSSMTCTVTLQINCLIFHIRLDYWNPLLFQNWIWVNHKGFRIFLIIGRRCEEAGWLQWTILSYFFTSDAALQSPAAAAPVPAIVAQNPSTKQSPKDTGKGSKPVKKAAATVDDENDEDVDEEEDDEDGMLTAATKNSLQHSQG